MVTIGILTVSTKGAAGQREDTSGEAIQTLVTGEPLRATVAARTVVADDRASIESVPRHWADDLRLHVVLTTGGTGFSPTDVTPEATLAVIERQAPGLAEAMRAESLRMTLMAMLSRAAAGGWGATAGVGGEVVAVADSCACGVSPNSRNVRLTASSTGRGRKSPASTRLKLRRYRAAFRSDPSSGATTNR
jgi:molybdopterin adenylyltransferase